MSFFKRLRSFLRREKLDAELDDELQFHLDQRTQDFIDEGMTPREARYAARRAFGNVGSLKEETRDAWGFRLLETLWQDVRYGARMLVKNPGFTAMAVISLALGIGVNTAIFSLINTLMLRMLPVQEPEQLVEFLNQYPGEPPLNVFSLQSYEYFRDYNHGFSGITGVHPSRFHVRGEGLEAEIVDGESVVGNFFQLLGVKPMIGRLLGPGDDRMGAADSAVAVMSWSYWKNKLNLDPDILGRRIVVEDVPVTVVGVAPRNFFGLRVGVRPSIWVPLAVEAMMHRPSRPDVGPLGLVGRLRPGVSIEQARAEMAVLFRFTLEERTRGSQDPLHHQLKFAVEPAGAGLSTALRDRFDKPLLALMAVVALLLLIACTNVANMLLARGATRQREMALRVSLGASRFRLVRQVLTESLLLSAAGALIGILLAYFGAEALVRIMTSGRPMIGMPHVEIQVHPDQHVLLFTGGVALLTGLLFGLAPALRAMAVTPASSLRAAGKAGETRPARLFGKSLVVAQVALSVVLLSAAGLFVRHLSNLRNLDIGFQYDSVLLVTLDPARSGYQREQLSRPYQELLGRLEAIPGVRSATLSACTPISGAGAARFANVEGFQEKTGDRRYLSLNWVAPKYFETLGTPLVAGRDFQFRDEGRPRVAIVNQAMARYYFAESSPIGKHVTFDGEDKPYEIVGLVGDAKYYELREAAPRTIYLNAFQEGRVFSQFAIRTNVAPAAVVAEVRNTVRDVLKTVPVAKVTTLADQVDASIVPERLIATLSGLFGALGAALAAIGLYGLLAYTVARRINEIGIRIALGAQANNVRWLILRQGLVLIVAGVALGIAGALALTRFISSMLYAVAATDPLTFIGVAALLTLVATAACYIPARRATKIDPMVALRHE